jgi:hypothetical protein
MSDIEVTVTTTPIDVYINSDPTVYVDTSIQGIQGPAGITGLKLKELSDVYSPNPNDKDLVVWNSGSGLWIGRQINTGDVSGIQNLIQIISSSNVTSLNSITGAINLYGTGNIFIYSSGQNLIISGQDESNDFVNYIVYTTGNQNISGVKTFQTGVNISGNLGIGIQNPSSKLHIYDNVSGSINPIINLEEVWNTTGTPTAIKLNVTDTASSNSSLLIDLQTGNQSKFRVDKIGNITFNGARLSAVSGAVSWSQTPQIVLQTNEYISLRHNPSHGVYVQSTIGASGAVFGFLGVGNIPRVLLNSSGNGILEQYYENNPQSFYIYNTRLGSASYERAVFKWSSNSFSIGTEQGSSSGLARNLSFVTSGQSRILIDSSGNVGIGTNTPSEKLQVEGNVLVNGNLSADEIITKILEIPNGLGPNSNISGFDLITANLTNPNNLISGYNIDALSVLISGNNVLTEADSSNFVTKTEFNSLSGDLLNLDIKIDNVSGSLELLINNLALSLGQTGSYLENQINSLSGTLTGNYATTEYLDIKIDNISGSLESLISGLALDLGLTGSYLSNQINSLSGTLTGSYATTEYVVNQINTVSGALSFVNYKYTLTAGYDEYEVFFPQPFNTAPRTIMVQPENDEVNIIYSYDIYAISTGGFNIKFSDTLNENTNLMVLAKV